MTGRETSFPRPSRQAEREGPPHDVFDVKMKSAGSSQGEFDPDDLIFPMTPARATVATATTAAPTPVIPHIRLSASSDLKEFHGRDQDEDRAQSWSSKVKIAFVRDQGSDAENV